MHQNLIKKALPLCLSAAIAFSGFLTNANTVYAEPASDSASSGEIDPHDYYALAEARKSLPIQSNEIANWPQGPQIGAEGAILMEANTGTVLYAKNMDEKLYPASTTKIMTALLAIENSQMDEMVTFSHDAVFSIERGSSNMGMDEGQSIPMEQALYGILVYSANEVCNAVGEHIAGDMNSYVEMMNQKATELGCTNTHFVTTNGLHDENHYTTPRDLATIARAFFANPTLSKMAGTAYYHVPQSPTQPDDDVDLYTHNLLTKKTYEYEGYVGGKTGYTTVARQTLVSCAERDGIKLICVIMKEESPNQFLDTIALFDYGFNNFEKVVIADNETNYSVNESSLFESDHDIFFSSNPIMEIDPNAYIIMPKTVAFDDLTSSLSYDNAQESESVLATIDYEYQGIYLGSADVTITQTNPSESFSSEMENSTGNENQQNSNNVLFINVIHVLIAVVAAFLLVLGIIGAITFVRNYSFSSRRRRGASIKIKRPKKSRRKRRRNNGLHDSW